MVRILVFGACNNLGGIEKYLYNISKYMPDVIFDFVSLYDNICFQKDFESNGSIIYKLPHRGRHPFQFLKQLAQLFKEHPEYHTVYCNMMSCSFIEPLILARLFNRKVVSHCHTTQLHDSLKTRMLNKINKPLVKLLTDQYWACSYEAGKWMFGEKIADSKLKIIYNGIEVKQFDFNEKVREQYRNKFNVNDMFVVGHVGRFEYPKNHFFIVNVFEKIVEQHKDSILLLIGDGSMKTEIKELVLEKGLEKQVKFLGNRSDIKELLQAMDVFIMPSWYEGISVAAIEALASGLKVFCSENVDCKTKLTENFWRMSLEKTAKEWADVILANGLMYERKSMLEKVRRSGFDINEVGKKVNSLFVDLQK